MLACTVMYIRTTGIIHVHLYVALLYSFHMFKRVVDRAFPHQTQQSINSCLKSRDKKGCKFSPLIKIPIDNIVIDELHLMLRITDVLLRNFVWAMEKLDQDEGNKGNREVPPMIIWINLLIPSSPAESLSGYTHEHTDVY